MRELKVNDIVTIEGSDTAWMVTSVNKDKFDAIDKRMGIIELEGIPIEEIIEVIGHIEDD
jgi:hypothetical protein